MELSTEKIWTAVLEGLRLTISEGAFNAYLKQTNLIELRQAGERWIGEVGCGSAFVKNTIDQRYVGQLGEELSRISGRKCEVQIVIKAKKNEEVVNGALWENTEKIDLEKIKKANIKESYTFENYAVGGSNQMAFAAAQAVARKPGTAYNPLFIYGGVGVGKTHLMQAIGHEILKKNGGTVLFCSGEEFTNDLVEAIRFKSTDKVRNKYRKVKLLMIDDVQFIAGKPTVQEEFFHTFNAIQREGGQIVMTSDRPPAEIAKLEERLRSRFGAGMIVDIGPADFEMRTAILLIKAKQRGVNLPMNIAQTIASNIEGVRELQGFLMKLMTEAEVFGQEITEEKVKVMLKIGKPVSEGARIVTPNEVITTVGNFYGVGVQQLKGERRNKTVAWPRQVLMYLLRDELKLPLEEVGRLIGGRDHTTVMHAANKIKLELEINNKLVSEVKEIKKRIFASG